MLKKFSNRVEALNYVRDRVIEDFYAIDTIELVDWDGEHIDIDKPSLGDLTNKYWDDAYSFAPFFEAVADMFYKWLINSQGFHLAVYITFKDGVVCNFS